MAAVPPLATKVKKTILFAFICITNGWTRLRFFMLHWKFCLAPTTQSSNHRFSYFATLVIINRIAAIYAFSFFLNIQPENSLMEVSRCVWGTESFIKEETFTCSYFFFPLRISTAALWLKSHLHISAHLINREKNIQKGWIPLKWCP